MNTVTFSSPKINIAIEAAREAGYGIPNRCVRIQGIWHLSYL